MATKFFNGLLIIGCFIALWNSDRTGMDLLRIGGIGLIIEILFVLPVDALLSKYYWPKT